jgi:hypothetical protein
VTYVNASGTVTPAALTVTANNASGIYGQTLPTFTYTVAGLQGSDAEGHVLTGLPGLSSQPNGAGNYMIGQGSMTVQNGDYTLNFLPATLTVREASPAPTARGYSGYDPVLTMIGMEQWPGWYGDDAMSTRIFSSGQFMSGLLAAAGGRGNGVNIPSMVGTKKSDEFARQFGVRIIDDGINVGTGSAHL